MAAYTVQTIPVSGLAGTYVAVSASDTFAPTSNQPHILHVKNAGASPDSVVIDDPNSVNPGSATSFDPDVTVSVTNATDKFIRIDPLRFKNTGTGNVTITHSFLTSVTAAVYVLP